MRYRTTKRAKRDREADKNLRDQLRETITWCEWCGRDGHVEIHELAQGNGLREKALDAAYAVLVLCRACHDELHHAGRVGKVMGLAILWHARPEHYSLPSYWRLTDRVWPEEKEVMLWTRRLLRRETYKVVSSDSITGV